MSFVSPRRRIRRWLLPLLTLTIIFLVVFVDFDSTGTLDTRIGDEDEGRPKQKKTRRIVEKWNADYGETEVEPDQAPPLLERTRVGWEKEEDMPKTKILRHVPGWTIYDNLYFHQGAFYVVTDSREHVPEIRQMISSGKDIIDEPQAMLRTEPTGQNMQIISPTEAKRALGKFAKRIEGTSFVVYDSPQYFSNPYNFILEIFFGLWRTYASLDTSITSIGDTTLPAPHRIILPHIIDFSWRDHHSLIPQMLHIAFPSASIQTAEDLSDFSETELTHLYDRVVLADRAAAMRSEDWDLTHHTAALTENLRNSMWWWRPIQKIFLDYSSSSSRKVVTRNVISYISHQGRGAASMLPEDHDELVRELSRLEGMFGYEVHVYRWDELGLEEQVEVASQSAILIGLHSDVMLPLIWMHPTPHSAIIEFYRDGDVSQNYAWNAQLLGIQAYAFYGASTTPYRYPTRPRYPPTPAPDAPYRSNGDAVAALCVEILTGANN